MSEDRGGLPLTVNVSVEEWAYHKRRAQYLEAVMIQVLRDQAEVREWFTAAQLAELRLTGLPRTKAGMTRLATAHSWRRRRAVGRGGSRYEYHVSSLPPRAFDDLVGRIVGRLPETDQEAAPHVPAPPPEPPAPDNTTAPWMLPLLRLVRGWDGASVEDLCEALPGHLPNGVPAPTAREVSEALRRLGFAM